MKETWISAIIIAGWLAGCMKETWMSAAVGTDPSCIAQESPLLMCSLQTHLFQDSVSPLDLYIEWESHASNEKTQPSNEKEKDTSMEWERCLYIGPLLIENILARRTFIFFFDTSTKNNICIICAPLGSVRTAASLPPSAVLHTLQKWSQWVDLALRLWKSKRHLRSSWLAICEILASDMRKTM